MSVSCADRPQTVQRQIANQTEPKNEYIRQGSTHPSSAHSNNNNNSSKYCLWPDFLFTSHPHKALTLSASLSCVNFGPAWNCPPNKALNSHQPEMSLQQAAYWASQVHPALLCILYIRYITQGNTLVELFKSLFSYTYKYYNNSAFSLPFTYSFNLQKITFLTMVKHQTHHLN